MEEGKNVKQTQRIRKEVVADIIVFVALLLFLISPLIQTIREYIAPHKETMFGVIRTYPFTIGHINYFTTVVVVLAWCTIAVKLMRKYQKGEHPKLFVPLVIFGILTFWMYISQMVNGFTTYAYVGDFYRNESLFTFMLYISGYFLLGTILRSDWLRWAAIISFLSANLIVGILVLIDYFVTPIRLFWDSEGMAAIFTQFNHYGYYLVIAILLSAILFVIAGGNIVLRVFCAVVYVVDNVILILNNTFGCYLAVIAALVFGAVVIAVIRKNRGECIRMLVILLAFIAITCTMRMLDYSNSKDISGLVNDIGNIAADSEQAGKAGTGRWALWKHTVEYISEKPVFGWGVEGITERLGMESDTINDRPHNEYLQWTAFFGIPGGLLYLAGLCVIMFGMFPRIKKSDSVSLACFVASAGYIASAFVGNTMYYTAPFFFIILGMMCRNRFYTCWVSKTICVKETEETETKEEVIDVG